MQDHSSGHHRFDEDVTARPTRGTNLVLPLFAVACSVISVSLLLPSGFGTAPQSSQFAWGFSLLEAAAYSGLGCALLAVIVGVISLRRRHAGGVVLSAVALCFALIAFGIPLLAKLAHQGK